jgi:putative ABC transport system permease protein
MLEGIPLGLIGGAAGLLLATWGVAFLESMLPANLPRHNAININPKVLLFTLSISIVTITIFGLLPALQATRGDVRDGLNEGGRGMTAGRRRSQVRSMLVAAELALALVLLIGAGLMARSFIKLRGVDTGFNSQNVLTMRIPLPEAKYSVPTTLNSPSPAGLAFFEQMLGRVRNIPGVQAAGVSTMLPLGAGSGWGKFFSIEGRPVPASVSQVPSVRFLLISEDYLATMGIPLLRGRAFTDRDTAESQQVAIINDTIARRFFADEDPLGKTIWMGAPESLLPPDAQTPENQFVRRTIVGVVADVKGPSLDKAANAEVLAPYRQYKREGWTNTMMLAVRTSGSPQGSLAAVRNILHDMDREQPITSVATMEERMTVAMSQPRFSTLLLGLFALTGLVLASVGIFGVMSYVVTQRTHEIGIRLALGASPGDLLALVVGQGFRLTLVGLAIGLTASLALTRLMSSLLFGVSATDLPTFGVISVLLTVVALLACYLPARRATKVDPMTALRYE